MNIERSSLLRAGGVAFVAAAVLFTSTLTQAQTQRSAGPAVVKAGGDLNDVTVAIAVPWQGNPGASHQTWSGAPLVLQGVARVATGCSLTVAEWDPGDGSGFQAVPFGNPRALELVHPYTAAPGTPFVATLRVTDDCGTTSTDTFRVLVEPPSLDVEVNQAIDHGLWYLHKRQVLSSSGGVDTGYWEMWGYQASPTASALMAMQAHGHRETGDADEDPYVETVARGLAHVMTTISARAIDPQPGGDPDANNNGIGIEVIGDPIYQGGQVIDALVGSGTPNAVAVTGGTNILGRTYKGIVQDMLDCYSWGQDDSGSDAGGWRYGWNNDSDNSAAQWWGVGAIPAERAFGCVVPQFVKDLNLDIWLPFSQVYDGSDTGDDGRFGYDNIWPIDVNGMNTTPSGVVQLIADDVQSSAGRFAAAEHFMVRNWALLLGGNRMYGMFAVTKAMRLASPAPVEIMTDGSGGTLDWYGADTTTGDPMDGLARHLVNWQQSDGSWSAFGYWLNGDLSTAWAIVILSSTIVELPPVAVCEADPEQTLAGSPIEFDGSASYHLDPQRDIELYEWDFDDDGNYDATGPVVIHSFDVNGVYPVTLKVTDDSVPPLTDTDTCIVQITPPPIPPNADPGGPYQFCIGENEPFMLDGSNSSDVDGEIVSLGWDFDPQPLDFSFDDATTEIVDVTAFFTNLGPGTYDVGLFVVDNNTLENTDYTTATVYAAGECPPVGGECNEGEALLVDSVVDFSDLDGSSVDGDGVSNGFLELEGLEIVGWGKILVDVPSATFLVNGDVLLTGEGKIDNYSWFLPEFGPSITVETCGSIEMRDRSRIRSHGDVYGGHILLCAEGDIVMSGIAGIECNGFDLPDGQAGGQIDVFAGGRFVMASILSYITVESLEAGAVHVAACSEDPEAIRIKGRILADGTGPNGVGGSIILDARNGGMYLPGVDKCLATGLGGDGSIDLYCRTILMPLHAPIVSPDPTIVFDGPDHGPCACTGDGGGGGDGE